MSFKLDRDLIVFDVESTSSDDEASIINLGAYRFLSNTCEVLKDGFEVFTKPYSPGWSEEAQSVHGLTKSTIAEIGIPVDESLARFEEWVGDPQKVFLAHWSSTFDVTLLKFAYKTVGKKYPFSYRSYDIASFVRLLLSSQGREVHKGLMSCATKFNVNTKDIKAHNAKNDAMVTALVLKRAIEYVIKADNYIKSNGPNNSVSEKE